MTVDPFRNHYTKTKLLRISHDLIKGKDRKEDDKILVHVEGKVLKVISRNGCFQEITIQDTASSVIIPVVYFEPLLLSPNPNTTLMCVGTIHFDWIPDIRCENVSYPVAIKATIIKQR